MGPAARPRQPAAEASAPPDRDALLTALHVATAARVFLVEVERDGRFAYLPVAHEVGPQLAANDDLSAAERAALERHYRACIESGQPTVYEDVVIGRWWQISLTPRREPGGRIATLIGVAIDITERRQVEARLRDAENQFAGIVGNLPGLVYRRVRHADGSITYPFVSSGAKALLGYDAETLRRHPQLMLATIAPEDRERFSVAVAQSARTLSHFDLELRSVMASGEYRWVRSTAQPCTGPEGSIVWDGVILDISDRKRAESEAAKASARLLDALNALAEGVAIFDADDRLVLCNTRYREINEAIAEVLVPGVAFADLLRAGLAVARFPDAIGREAAWIEERLARHRAAGGRFEQLTPGGRWLQVLEQRTPDGGVIILATDITAVRRRQEAMTILAAAGEAEDDFLVAAARSLRAGLGHRWAGVCRVLPGGAEAETLAWIDGEKVLDNFSYPIAGTPCSDLIAEARFFAVPDRLSERYPEDRELQDMGAQAYVGQVVRDGSGVVVGHVFAIDDRPDPKLAQKQDVIDLVAARVSYELQRREAERALLAAKESAELASRAKSEFLANMSHELRTPLNAVLGFSEIIGQEILGPAGRPEYADYARDIHASSSHLLQIINDILDVSKIEAGMMSIYPTTVDAPTVVHNCCRLVRPRAAEAKVELATEMTEAVAPILADERMLKQIVLNLVSNAIKFTPEGGRVTVRTGTEASGWLVISVADTGIGIAADDLDKVMRPFGQVESSLARRFAGTGLGLPLSKGFVELHGGTLSVESTPGAGTTVLVRLPPRPLNAAAA